MPISKAYLCSNVSFSHPLGNYLNSLNFVPPLLSCQHISKEQEIKCMIYRKKKKSQVREDSHRVSAQLVHNSLIG